jgi:5-hydroxyisourate hydrolase-like protein (transthyretin family)
MNRSLPSEAQPSLRVHVFDVPREAAAAGLRVEIFRLGQDAQKRCSGRIGADGVLVDPELHAGEYEVVVHLGAYYRSTGNDCAAASLLESVTLRLCIADLQRSCDVSLRITPLGICMPGV